MNKKNKIFNDLYDLIKGDLSKNRKTEWEKLSYKHYQEARKNINGFIKEKNIKIDSDTGIISIGKNFEIKLLK